jgi:hypothetical protein
VSRFRQQYERILEARPGITDPASLKFRDEAAILGSYSNPEEAYVTAVLPAKLRLGEEYLRGSSLLSDLAGSRSHPQDTCGAVRTTGLVVGRHLVSPATPVMPVTRAGSRECEGPIHGSGGAKHH